MGEKFADFPEHRIGWGFFWVIGAGLATCVGASVVFYPSVVQRQYKRVLSAGLAFAAGVMLYVSMVDIVGKSVQGFAEALEDDENVETLSKIYATFSFFGGIFFMWVLNKLVVMLFESTGQSNLHVMQEEFIDKLDSGEVVYTEDEKVYLKEMGFVTALAIALHNFPEGFLTFVGYVNDPYVGVPLAVGIGIHNLPEGMCVALPIYYATGERWRGFLWGGLTGATEILGALLGYVIIKQNLKPVWYGVMFGLVGGIMTFISLEDLLPFAFKYDPKNTVVTWSILAGMFCIAASLMLFNV